MIGEAALTRYLEAVLHAPVKTFVLSRTRPVQSFGHDYPADRAWQALYGHHGYNSFPRHVRSVDVGVVHASGLLHSLGDAEEFFQLVEKAGGTPYWADLQRLLDGDGALAAEDVERAEALARFLAVDVRAALIRFAQRMMLSRSCGPAGIEAMFRATP